MKEKGRKILCSIMPFWVENLYIRNRYDMKRISIFGKVILMLLPSAFLYIVSNYKLSDKRNIKYWLPYGMMCDFQLKTYGKRIENKNHSVVLRFIRWLLPYGYVLWWDSGDHQFENRSTSSSVASSNNTSNNASVLATIQTENEKNRMLQMELAERLEVGLLKLTIELKNQKT